MKSSKGAFVSSSANAVVISPIMVGAVAKIDDEVYVLSAIKIYSYFPFFLFCAKESRVVENFESGVATLKIVTVIQKW